MPPISGFDVKTTRRGIEANLPHSPGRAPGWVKQLRNNSFHMTAAKCFNCTPSWVRDKVWGTVDQFKLHLNKYLTHVPDHPRDHLGGFFPEATDPSVHTPSNSLIHWYPVMRRKHKDDWIW